MTITRRDAPHGARPALTPDDIHVWTVGLGAPREALPGLVGGLDETERARLARLTSATDRRRFTVAHAALRGVLSRYVPTEPRELRFEIGRWGRPEIAGDHRHVRFSLTHCEDLALVAVAVGRGVGVDAERARPALTAVAARFFPAGDAAHVASVAGHRRALAGARLLTRKEACAKAVGERLLPFGLALPVFSPGDRTVVANPVGGRPAHWYVRDLPAPPGFAAAVARPGARPPRLWFFRWAGPEGSPEGGPDRIGAAQSGQQPAQ
ncbi:MAG: 4'-phosphopantetheinyl transferase superfamily protein [Streptomyces sp.]|nr:4'-phosphopantetheinyl transferase superfamily protein [Streptomyces sp.]NUS11152.1 4'-phosphopantetheinyl transferase superfamily protein [Streptomyces sp.]